MVQRFRPPRFWVPPPPPPPPPPCAVKAGFDDLVHDLLLAGANPNVRQSDSHGTPLHTAAKLGLANTVSVLLSSPSTDKNALDNNGCSPLMDASLHGRVTTVKVLLAAGADAGMRGPWDAASALSLAAQFGEIGVMKALLEHGVDVNDGGVGRWSALHWAAQFNSAGCVAVLLDAGADINDMSEKSEGQTPFHFAAKAGSNEALLALLRLGASVDQKNDDGLTALHLAGRVEGDDMDHTVDILLRWGASEQAVDQDEKTSSQNRRLFNWRGRGSAPS
ncbi:ankyrin repeat protein [Ectocarpus siliculosus]|uniref:Ankyrin repeat protein n=1 Tax=Ectocarpus siliculosus TaxID=2880 RepID=D7FXA0_ECTSI|nr:ankyrin repeat protein [Ectocarpus siliculosus]|eukprot:CBJ32237.1 ankyrin repeat protein [Ectocarpus siliculosus]